MLRSIPGDRQPEHKAAAASHLEILLFLIRNCLAQAKCWCTRARSINNDDSDDDDNDDYDEYRNNTE